MQSGIGTGNWIFTRGKKNKKQNQIQFSVVHKALTFAGLGQVMVSSLSSNFYGEVDSWTWTRDLSLLVELYGRNLPSHQGPSTKIRPQIYRKKFRRKCRTSVFWNSLNWNYKLNPILCVKWSVCNLLMLLRIV